MPTTYTSLLGLALPATGELSGTWGTTVNDAITSLVDSSVAGTTTLSSDADVTLTTTSGVANQARQAIILWTANGSTTRNITAPATSKTYVVINASAGTQSIVIRGAGPTTGVTIIKGERAVVAWNGSDFVKVATPPAGSDTQVQYNSSGSLAGSANLTFNGTTLTANALTVSTGNLTFSGTAQRITGDMSNATQANRLAFQTSTANGVTTVYALPNGTATFSAYRAFNNADPTNAAFLELGANGSTEARLVSSYNGTGTYLPMTFATGGSERMRIDTSGNVAVGTTNAGTAGVSLNQGYNLSWEQSATESIPNLFRQTSSGALVMSVGYKRSATANGFASSFGSSLAKTAISMGTTAGAITFYTDTAATTAVGTDVTPTERMRIDSSGNVGIGTAPSYTLDVYRSGTNTSVIVARNDNSVASLYSTSSFSFAGTSTNTPFGFITNNAERMRITATGNIVAGASAALATNATDGFLYVPTCAGTPTGTPTAITGMAPIVVDTTNNKLYFYSGGTWRDAGP